MKLIPYIKAAQAVKSNIRFWASPWSPPTWMKTGPVQSQHGRVALQLRRRRDEERRHDPEGVRALPGQVRPGVRGPGHQRRGRLAAERAQLPAELSVLPLGQPTFVTFVGKYLGPALTTASLATRVMDGTLSNPSGDADIGQSVLRDATAKGYVKSIGVQWGMADSGPVTHAEGPGGQHSPLALRDQVRRLRSDRPRPRPTTSTTAATPGATSPARSRTG